MPENRHLDEPKTRKLKMPGKRGAFSGRAIEGKCWGQDLHRAGENTRDWVYIYGWDEAREWFKTDFKLAQKYEHDRVLTVTGAEGFGKSTLAILLAQTAAKTANKELTIDDIIFSRDKLSERLRNAESGDVLVVDEAGVSMFAQEWWDEMQKEVIKRLVVGRVKGLRIFFVSPHLGMLNKQIRERRLDQWLHVKPVGRYGRGEAQMAEPSSSKYYMNIYWEPRLTLKYPKIESDLWEEYRKKKLNFVNKVWSGSSSSAVQNLERYAVIHRLQDKGWSSKEIAKCLTIKSSTVRTYLSKLKDNENLLEIIKEKTQEI